MSKYGRLDIMYSNAGITGINTSSIMDLDFDDWKKVLDVNINGGFLCAKHVARAMIPAKKGVILFTASIASKRFGLGSHAYTVSKVAIAGLTKNLCVDLGKYGIRVNCISPHLVSTPLALNALPFSESVLDEIYESIAVFKDTGLKAEDAANMALYSGER
ncbi:hypothetical protein Droror1_Dr00013803 [Drosera rotundifolia]